MPRLIAIPLLALCSLSGLTACGGEAIAGVNAMIDAESRTPVLRDTSKPMSAVQALDYCDSFMGWEKIDCFERVGRGEDPSKRASR
ncbi:hypothetical protein D0B54_08865 [Solimonas sp. K1W22B-7]|uniref:hypothetical protein n=1 Tax=Solimonas sp. K1W22B-7 TaxID=2303331 RepID=UPI000E33112D|nr:hypothetical protein [Solimonas sp. K1W22B-7]AXQ28786.1 hypothetical protein D0B54_08865 [Solimonas sp. K1W22B-7]